MVLKNSLICKVVLAKADTTLQKKVPVFDCRKQGLFWFMSFFFIDHHLLHHFDFADLAALFPSLCYHF